MRNFRWPSARLTILFLLLLALVLILQWRGGAYSTDLGAGAPDETAHFVTGLMVRDYLAAGFPKAPMAFAQEFYLHYPKVGIGAWPPLFYAVEGVWLLLFPATPASALVLIAVLTSSVATLLYHVLESALKNRALCLSLTVLFILMPLVQVSAARIMLEIPTMALCFVASLLWARYLETETVKYALWFGVVAGLAILTKGNTLALALLPPLTALIQRRLSLLWSWKSWLAALVVAILCGPWYLLTYKITAGGFGDLNQQYFISALGLNLKTLVAAPGWIGGVGVLLGLGLVLTPAGRRHSLWATAAAFLLAIYLLHAIVPAALDERYMAPAAPFLILLLGFALSWIQERLNAGGRAVLASGMAIVVFFGFAIFSFRIPRKESFGVLGVASDLTRPEFTRWPVMLISGLDGDIEGSLIAELAYRHNRPGQVLLRGGRIIASSDWRNLNYKLRLKTPEELANYLDSVAVGVVVFDWSRRNTPPQHQQLLYQTMTAWPDRWIPAPGYPSQLGPDHQIHLLTRSGDPPAATEKLKIPIQSLKIEVEKD